MGAADWARVRREARNRRAETLGPDSDAPAPIAIEAALRFSRLRCRPRPPADALLSGAQAVLDIEADTIWHRADLAPDERCLVIAHELGHLWLHHDAGEGCCCDTEDFEEEGAEGPVSYGPRERREAEANVFAREFLLPTPLLLRWFYEDGLSASGIAARAGLKERVVLLRLTEALTPEPPEVAPVVGPAPALDESQRRAAQALQGPLLVGAGPGTGKTRTLTARVLFLTRERGQRPESLLALTFSRRAAEEMRERIGAEAPVVASRAFIGTFHSYGLDLLRRYWQVADLPPQPVLLDPADGFALLERHLARCGLDSLRYLHDPAFPLPDILGAVSRAKEELLSPDEYARRAEEAGEERLIEVGRVYRVYEDLLRSRGALDFADLVMRPVRLLESNPDVLAAERARWQSLLVDEYQDVNRAGAYLVRLLAGENDAGLWAVGDLRQAIYAFRGASPANVSAFERDYPRGKRTELAVNYRSFPALVRLFGAACGEGEHAWHPARSGSGTATLAIAPDDIAQADGIAAAVLRFADRGYPLSDQVALCRTRGQAAALREALASRGIAVARAREESNLFSSSDVKDLLALVSRVAEPSGPSAHRIPDVPAGIPERSSAWELLARVLFGAPGWARRVSDRPAVGRLLALARGFEERAALIDEDEDSRRAFLRHVRRIARMGMAGGDAEPEPVDAMRVLTVHASKGLEFPVVFVPNLSKGKFPPQAPPSLLPTRAGGEREEDEEARLFFVALTRARDHLILSRAEKYNGRSAQPSPLLACLEPGEGLKRVEWERGERAVVPAAEPHGAPLPDTHPHLEAWEAELYGRCPRRFYYERVLKLPTGASAPYDGFRRAVQGTLRRAASGDDPVQALAECWSTDGPDPAHPHAPLYRAAAEEIVRDVRPAAAAPADAPAPIAVTLENGTVSVRADAAPTPGCLERHTFRKPPKEGKPDAEARLTLLRTAAERQGEPDVQVHIRYLRTGDVIEAPDRPRLREKHLAVYDDALRGVRRGEYPPAPDDEKECPSCPFFFICPA